MIAVTMPQRQRLAPQIKRRTGDIRGQQFVRLRFDQGHFGGAFQQLMRAREIVFFHRERGAIEDCERLLWLSLQGGVEMFPRFRQMTLAHLEASEIDQHPRRIGTARDRALQKSALILPIERAPEGASRAAKDPNRYRRDQERTKERAQRLPPPDRGQTEPEKKESAGQI